MAPTKMEKTEFPITILDERVSQIKVEVTGKTVSAEHILLLCAQELGLNQHSLQYIALFEGKDKPRRIYKDLDEIECNKKEISLQKWCFDVNTEKQALAEDDGILKLFFDQAKADIERGKLKPEVEQKAQLEEYCDPAFYVPLQYIKLCQSLDDYTSVVIKDCILADELLAKVIRLPKGKEVTIAVTRRGLRLESESNKCFVSWRKVKSWSASVDDLSVTYEIYSISNNNFVTLSLRTSQAPYLLAATMEMIRLLQRELNSPRFQTTSSLGLDSDLEMGSAWNNVMFTIKRTALEERIGQHFLDLSL